MGPAVIQAVQQEVLRVVLQQEVLAKGEQTVPVALAERTLAAMPLLGLLAFSVLAENRESQAFLGTENSAALEVVGCMVAVAPLVVMATNTNMRGEAVVAPGVARLTTRLRQAQGPQPRTD